MREDRIKRRLAAILATDVANYSGLMERDEAGTLSILRDRRTNILAPLVAKHQGRVFKVMGDGALVEFGSAVSAVSCAVELQQMMEAANVGLPHEERIRLRIGVNLADLIVDAGDLYGDGINIAARLQAMAEPGSVYISAKVRREVERHLSLDFIDLGERAAKNLSAPIHVFRIGHGKAHTETPVPKSVPSATVLQRPAVAVLPFLNLSGDPSEDYFVDGVTEDLITALSAWRWFPVIARNSTFVYKGRAVDIAQIGKDLAARYVVQGSVRRQGDRVRIAAQLIEVKTAHQLWAQNYDRQIGDVFALQDEITRALIGAIEPELARAEQQRALRKPPENLDAWDFSLQALAEIRKGTNSALNRAETLLVQAAALDQTSSYAQSLLALTRFQGALLFGWLSQPSRSFLSTYEAAEAAVALDDGDWLAHALLGIAALWSHGNYQQATLAEQTAISLNPSAAMAYHFYGCVLTFNDQPAEALPNLQAVLKLDPRFQLLPTTLADIALAHFLLGDCEKAVEFCQRALSQERAHVRAWQRLAAVYGSMGRTEDAQAALAQMLKLQPDFGRPYLKATYPFRNPDHILMLENGLRQAGWRD